MIRGRPLYFMALVLTGWIGARAALRWPAAGPMPLAAALPAVEPRASFRHGPVPEVSTPPVGQASRVARVVRIAGPSRAPRLRPRLVAVAGDATGRNGPALLGSLAGAPEFREAPTALPQPSPPPGLPAMTGGPGRSRWSASAWAILRDGHDGGRNRPDGPLLGGSQAGFRLAYAIGDPRDRIAVFARGAVALGGARIGNGRADLGLGAQWRPTAAPVTLFAELRRDGRGSAPATGLFGGGSTRLGDFRLAGYGQAGMILRAKPEVYGDGELRLSRAIGPVEVGTGLWAAGQRGAARVDAGPALAVPVRTRLAAMRVTLDWRHRIAGDARPASGPVLALGADF